MNYKPLIPVKKSNKDPLELILSKQDKSEKTTQKEDSAQHSTDVAAKFKERLLKLGYDKKFKDKETIINQGVRKFLNVFYVDPDFFGRISTLYTLKSKSELLTIDEITTNLIKYELVDTKDEAAEIINMLKKSSKNFGSKYHVCLEEKIDGLGNSLYSITYFKPVDYEYCI